MAVNPFRPLTQRIVDSVESLLGRREVKTLTVKRGNVDEADVLLMPKPDGTFEPVTPRKLLEDYREFPQRRKGTATLTTLQSFIEHVNRMKDEQSAVFLDDTNQSQPKMLAVFDYHLATKIEATELEADEQGEAFLDKTSNSSTLARHLEHRASYAFPISPEWREWNVASSKWLEQGSFAAWLEERIVDVLDPSSAGDSVKAFASDLGATLATKQKLLELSKGLALNVEHKLANKVNLSTGEAQFIFEEHHSNKDGGTLSVPGGFAIAIPVLRGGDLFQIPVRLRYQVREGKVHWLLAPHGVERIFDVAISEAESLVATETGLPVFRGQPER